MISNQMFIKNNHELLNNKNAPLKMNFVAASIAFNLINNNDVALCARRTTHSLDAFFSLFFKISHTWFTLRASIRSSVLVIFCLYLVLDFPSVCFAVYCQSNIYIQNHSDKWALRLTIVVILASAFFFILFLLFFRCRCFHLSSAFIQIDETVIFFLLFWHSFVWWPEIITKLICFFFFRIECQIYTISINSQCNRLIYWFNSSRNRQQSHFCCCMCL